MAKDKMLIVRINEKEKNQLEKDAKNEQRTVSNFILWLWKQWRKDKKK